VRVGLVPKLTDEELGLDDGSEVVGAEALEGEAAKVPEATGTGEGRGEVHDVRPAAVGHHDVGAILDVAVDDAARVDTLYHPLKSEEELRGELAVGVLGAIASVDVLHYEGMTVEHADKSGHAGSSRERAVDARFSADEPRPN